MSSEYRIQFFGNVEAQRTEAEIFLSSPPSVDPWAVLYDSTSGFVIEFLTPASATCVDVIDAAIADAREGLLQYVNRRGQNPPVGLTPVGLSLWLMEKVDGTAMGRQINVGAA
jgi:hypothetical protein